MSESDQQAIVVNRFKAKYPKYKIFAVPNGTHIKSHAGRAKAKKEGLLKGVSDLIILVPRGQYHGCVVEMKDIGKTQCSVTPDQKAFIEYCHWQGYKGGWFAGAEPAWEFIDDYMGIV